MVIALDVLDLDPQFPVETIYQRRTLRAPLDAGSLRRRSGFTSQSLRSSKREARRFRLRFEMASRTDKDRMLTLDALSGRGAAIEFLPPDETTPANLLRQPNEFTGSAWSLSTTDASIADDSTAAPSSVGGTADLLSNGSGATAPAAVVQPHRFFVRTGFTQVVSVHVEQPSTSASSWFVLSIKNTSLGIEHSVTWNWTGSAWSQTATALGATGSVSLVSGSIYRFQIVYTSATATLSTWPQLREVRIQSGKSGAVEAGKGLLVSGAMLEEFVTVASTYNGTNTRVPVVIASSPLSIVTTSPGNFAWDLELEEVISGP